MRAATVGFRTIPVVPSTKRMVMTIARLTITLASLPPRVRTLRASWTKGRFLSNQRFSKAKRSTRPPVDINR